MAGTEHQLLDETRFIRLGGGNSVQGLQIFVPR